MRDSAVRGDGHIAGALDEMPKTVVIALLRAARGRHAGDHRPFPHAAQLVEDVGECPSQRDDNSRRENARCPRIPRVAVIEVAEPLLGRGDFVGRRTALRRAASCRRDTSAPPRAPEANPGVSDSFQDSLQRHCSQARCGGRSFVAPAQRRIRLVPIRPGPEDTVESGSRHLSASEKLKPAVALSQYAGVVLGRDPRPRGNRSPRCVSSAAPARGRQNGRSLGDIGPVTGRADVEHVGHRPLEGGVEVDVLRAQDVLDRAQHVDLAVARADRPRPA